jgi:hypothetical protein
MTQKQPDSLNHACLSHTATRVQLKNDNDAGNEGKETGRLNYYRLILSAPPGGLRRGIPDVNETLAERLEGHPLADSSAELRGSESSVSWQLRKEPWSRFSFRSDNLGMIGTMDWIDALEDFRPNQDRDWLVVLIQTDSGRLSFLLRRVNGRMRHYPERHRFVINEKCGMCYCSYPAIPEDGVGHEPLRQVTLACSVAAGKLQSVIPEFLRNFDFMSHFFCFDHVSSIDWIYGGPHRVPETFADTHTFSKIKEAWRKQEGECGQGSEPVLWSGNACVMTFTSPFFLAETQAGCTEPVAWHWHEGLSSNSDMKQDRLWIVLEADARDGEEGFVESLTQLAAALEQGITEKAEKHTAGGWAFRTFKAAEQDPPKPEAGV